LEKELLVMRTTMVDKHGCASDKQLDAMKQKTMKLRKENEVLKRQLLASDVHAKVKKKMDNFHGKSLLFPLLHL